MIDPYETHIAIQNSIYSRYGTSYGQMMYTLHRCDENIETTKLHD